MQVSAATVAAVHAPAAATAPTSAAGTATLPAATAVTGRAVADATTLSPLASSLRDESLTAFNALPTEVRTQLSTLVDGGTLKGEDVHNALKHRLKEARSNAYWAASRMMANDHAALSFSEDTTAGDFKDALRQTLDRRSGLVDKLAALDREGKAGSAERAEVSGQLEARDMNPILAGTPVKMSGLFSFGLTETRMMRTRTETDAAYKLKNTGIDLSAIDRALRPVGERDAASIVSERAGLPSATTVADDREFTMGDALFAFPPPSQGNSGLETVEKGGGAYQRISQATLAALKPADESAAVSREYLTGIRARY